MAMTYIKAFYDWLTIIEPLTDEERGRVFTALLHYGKYGEVLPGMGREALTFAAIRAQIDRENESYTKRVANGKRGGRPKETEENQSKPTITKDNQEKPKESIENQNKPNITIPNHRLAEVNLGLQEKEKEKEEEKEKDKYILSGKPDSVGEIIGYLNQVCGTHYKATTPETVRLVRVRLKEGFTVDDFKRVIDTMHDKWGGSADMARYLRPQTLFGTKFESYLNTAAVQIVAPVKGFENYTPNTNSNNDLYERAAKLLEG